MFCKKGVFKNLVNFTGKHLCWSLRPAHLLKRESNTSVPVKFTKFLRTSVTAASVFSVAKISTSMGEIIPEQTSRNEKNSEEAINYEILPVTMVDRQRKFFI